ncbi:hypothetical protein CHS0354_015978 [Potamilus streckersoni]|uniref:Phosphatidylinositol N-acetylglucosaminyltransferase subunit Q n=1 Tax=Potamilus streckersoni TaxID=2493646 RepID=A0AAE0SIT1_9BIVA|nr:hypothetical protein CHS0354_015978 [Potamilus streckersoni]
MDSMSVEDSTELWKVFVPQCLLNSQPADLLGLIHTKTHCICITASSFSIQSDALKAAQTIQYLGKWHGHLKKLRGSTNKNFCIDVWLDKFGLINCQLLADSKFVPCTCITYEPGEFLKSCCFTNQKGHLRTLIRSLADTEQKVDTMGKELDFWMYGQVSEEKQRMMGRVWMTLLHSLMYLYWPFRYFLALERNFPNLLGKAMHVPSVTSQLLVRSSQNEQVTSPLLVRSSQNEQVTSPLLVRSSQNEQVTSPLLVRSSQNEQVTSPLLVRSSQNENVGYTAGNTGLHKMRCMNVYLRQAIDTVLGILLMLYLMQGDRCDTLAMALHSWAEHVAGELKVLLNWLMGAPAGLKLNSQLTHFMGHFFLYHIYLWKGYLYLLKSILGQLIWYSSITGILGMSIQLALFQDILSTLTIHIYCFYVYAARLYRLQVYALSSLWRLFRGKKWNVLRQRIDSAVYDVDQLFLGTLMFTILLFLLPTTALYYVVFTLLRLVVLILQGLLNKLRAVLNMIPVWSICLWCTKSSLLASGAVFHVLPKGMDSPETLYLSMQVSFYHIGSLI